MARIIALFFACTIVLGAIQAVAADENIHTCALIKAYECTSDDGCVAWTIPEMGLPRFVRINLKEKTLVSLDKEITRTTKLTTVERLDKITVLQGIELRGWTIALGNDAGSFTLTAAGNDEAFIVFGNCMNQ
jgi:hypothetical protein